MGHNNLQGFLQARKEGIVIKLLKCPEDHETIRNILSKIDYSNALVTNCTKELLKSTCDDALKYGFAAVAVFPSSIEYVVDRLKGSPVHAQIPVGFPCGNHLTAVKLKEAEIGLNMGAKEVDMVMNLNRFFDKDYNYVRDEVRQMVELAKGYQVGVKLIIEVGYLTDEQKLIAGSLAVEGGAEYIKTCTGTTSGRATMHDIALLKNAFGDAIKLKASGGIASLEDAGSFIELGASRSAGRSNMVEQLEVIGYLP